MDYQPILLVDQYTGKYARNDEYEGWMWTAYIHLATKFDNEGEAKKVAHEKFTGRTVYLLDVYTPNRH